MQSSRKMLNSAVVRNTAVELVKLIELGVKKFKRTKLYLSRAMRDFCPTSHIQGKR